MIPYRFVKRGLDVITAVGVLAVASPVIAVTGVLVAKNLGRPILFSQLRPGRDGKLFRLYKFRSMKDVDPDVGLITDEQRLTDFGRWLRATSLDELPSFFNVLRGDMSVVGPRPLLVSYLQLYSPQQSRRHEVRPGITGLAQVNGRNLISWSDRLALDVAYVDNMSLISDAKILLRTVGAVVRKEGISAEGVATMHEFTGASTNRVAPASMHIDERVGDSE